MKNPTHIRPHYTSKYLSEKRTICKHIHLTHCLWLFFSLQGLPTNQTTTTTTWSGSSSVSSLSSTSSAASAPRSSIAKVVNPLGTVTTIVESQNESSLDADEFAEEYSSGAYIHENCDESMFRPYVAVISGSIDDGVGGGSADAIALQLMAQEKPEPIGQKLIVPVIDSAQLEEQKNRAKSRQLEIKQRRQDDEAKRRQDDENVAKFEQMSLLNRKQDKSNKADSKVEEPTRKKSIAADEKKSSSKNVMASKEPEKSSEEKLDEPMVTKSEKKGKNEPETVTVKLKKKSNKAQVNKTIDPPIECDDTATKKTKSPAVADELPEQKSYSDPIVVEFVAPKPMKSKKKSPGSESGGSSKESSVEKDLVMITAATTTLTLAPEKPEPVAEPTSKSKKKKQKKSEAAAAAAAAAAISTSSSDDAKVESVSEQLFAFKGSSKSKADDSASTDSRNPFLMEDIEHVDSAKCAEIQESLLKTSISATVSIRKGSYQEKQHRDGDEKPSSSATPATSSTSGKSGRKKKWSKESIESYETPASNNDSPGIVMDEFTYPDPSELTDADNLSFKSTIDDQITMIPFESVATVDDNVEWPSLGKASGSGAAVTSEYDKLSDEADAEAEMGSSGTQYADCKNFQLVIDESESYLRTATTTISDTNSSDDMEDSSKSTKSTSEKIIDDDDDEELQPLIRSTASDSAAADSSSAKGSDDNTLPNQSDSVAQPTPIEAPTAEANEPSQSQSQKPTNSSTTTSGGGGGSNNNNNNKKKFRKKRR